MASGLQAACDNPAMAQDDRFDDLIESLAGFHRSWLIYLGLELGLFAALRDAGERGLTPSELATATATHQPAIDVWAWAADAHRLTVLEDGRLTVESAIATVLLDDDRADFLGGQFAFSVGASLEHGGLVDVIRSGRPHPDRSATFHRSVERLNAQDTTLFLEQGVSSVPGLRQRLEAGIQVLDVACGGGGWLMAMAEAYPVIRGTGIEFDPEWLATARARIGGARLQHRITIEEGDPASVPAGGRYGLVYLQDVLHEMPDPAAALAGGWRVVEQGGWLVVLDWCLPSSWEEYRTRQGELLWGYQLDELYQGTSLLTRAGFERLFQAADLPAPERIELDAGATLFVLRREA